MQTLTKEEFIKMIWGISSHDRRALEWNTEFLSNGGRVCLKEEQPLARKIGMLFNEINRELQKDNTIRAINIGDALIEKALPTKLIGTKVEPLFHRALEFLNELSY